MSTVSVLAITLSQTAPQQLIPLAGATLIGVAFACCAFGASKFRW